MNKNTLNTATAYSISWTIFSVVLLFSGFIFLLKVIFEGNILPKNTQVNIKII